MLSELIEFVRRSSNEYAETLGPEDDWLPTLFVATIEGAIGMAIFDGKLLGDKQRFSESIIPSTAHQVATALHGEIGAVVFLSATWMISMKGDASTDVTETIAEIESDPDFVMPSQSPDRIEGLIVVGVSKDDEQGAIAEIARSEGPPTLEWWDDAPENMAGPMMGAVRRALWDA